MFGKVKKMFRSNKIGTVKPIVELNDMDKVYLACARRNDARFAYVLALVCTRQENTRFYNMFPQTEVLTFESPSQADAYYGTVQQISKIQQAGLVGNLFSAMDDQIKAFNQKSR